MKKLLVIAALLGMTAAQANAEYLVLYPELKCSQDADWKPYSGVSGSIINTITQLSANVFIVRLQEGLPLFVTDKGRSCIDSGMISLGENQEYNDGIAIVDGSNLVITFSSQRVADEDVYNTPNASINSTIQMILSYVPAYDSYKLHNIVLLEKLIAEGQSVTVNEKLISPKDIYYGFSAGIQP